MARLVNIQDDLYKLSVTNGGTIYLNTGTEVGTVVVSGNLTVLGESTSVETTNMEIEDNIILLNKGELGSTGVTEETSGLQIQRSLNGTSITHPDVLFIFDENENWRDPATATTEQGLFTFKRVDDRYLGIKVHSIVTDTGVDLNLLARSGSDNGTEVITVKGCGDYEERVLDYTAPGLPARDPDTIPNIKAVTDYVTEYFNVNPPFKIQDSEIIGGVTYSYDSVLEIHDSLSDGGTSNLELQLDGTTNAIWLPSYHEVQDIRISSSTIECTATDEDLVLASPGLGSVSVNDNLKLVPVVSDPVVSDSPETTIGTKIYAKDEAAGGTGIFFVNTKSTSESITTRDELVSRRKALAYSMIF